MGLSSFTPFEVLLLTCLAACIGKIALNSQAVLRSKAPITSFTLFSDKIVSIVDLLMLWEWLGEGLASKEALPDSSDVVADEPMYTEGVLPRAEVLVDIIPSRLESLDFSISL